MRELPVSVVAFLLLASSGCTVRMEAADGGVDAPAIDAPADARDAPSTLDGGAAPDGSDAPAVDAPRDTPDAWVDRCSPACGDEELCGERNDGNGLDDDCDGEVDEDCVCMAGT